MSVVSSILWKRLNGPGHDACDLEQVPGGWRVEGMAVFREDGVDARLEYRVACDAAWRTQEGEVAGSIGGRRVSSRVARAAGGVWTLNDRPVAGLEDCMDLDLGCTPATNLLQLRRIALRDGQSADVPVAWLDVQSGTFERLAQRYSRRGESAYWYESPRFDYRALLEVDAAGFVVRYPGLWEMEPEETRRDSVGQEG